MKKVLFLCDIDNYPEGAFEFVRSVNSYEPLLLTGIFFHSITAEFLLPVNGGFTPNPIPAFSQEDKDGVKSSIEKFSQRCGQYGIEYRTHEESSQYDIGDFVKESRFADLAVLSEELFFSHLSLAQPNIFMQQVIHRAECPLLIIPERFVPFNHIIAAYDGKKNSMFAIKKFCYLLPAFTNLPVTLMYLKEGDRIKIPDLAYLEEFAGRHFSSLSIQKLDFVSKHGFQEWISNRSDVLLISGSYSRSALFAAIKENFAEEVIRQHNAPVFIAHHT